MSKYTFSLAPHANIPRSTFDRSHKHLTTLNAGDLVPIYVDEVVPGDTLVMDKMSLFGRVTTLAKPIMDNMKLDWFAFFVPHRIVWNHWKALQGERKTPDASIDYLVPQINSGDGFAVGSLADYFGIRTGVPNLSVSALAFRAYNLIYDEWFRDENLCDPTNMSEERSYGDGPDDFSNYPLRKSAKFHDYFTSCLPWPQKGGSVVVPLGKDAPVVGNGPLAFEGSSGPVNSFWQNTNMQSGYVHPTEGIIGGFAKDTPVQVASSNSGLVCDLSQATASLVSTLRDAWQVQKVLERDARSGTRYREIIKGHFGVDVMDSRMQIPEFLASGTTDLNVQTVAQTSQTTSTSSQADLAAYGTISGVFKGFGKSFTEHGTVMILARIRADLTYQQGTPHRFFQKSRYDFYLPEFACISEQAVKNREIFTQGDNVKDSDGNIVDEQVFGYQEAWAFMRYSPNIITGQMRSDAPLSLDVWHLAQKFENLPALNSEFIEENVPMDRVLAVTTADGEPQFKLDCFFSERWTRPMPMYSVPGLVDHF